MSDAVILAGAVAKGAWSAGALGVLLEPETQASLGLDIRRVVATSSGAINGAFVASHVRDGSAAAAGPLLEQLWIELADFGGVFNLSPRAIAGRRGISTSKKVRALLQTHVTARPGIHPIELAVVVTNLDGEVDVVGTQPATTYERCLRFDGPTFDDDASLAPLFDAVVASSAFPIAFEPAEITLGLRDVRCIDGGVVNTTPIKYALGQDAAIDRVFVVAPYPRVQENARDLHGVALLAHIGEILVEERLVRDIREAHDVNRALRALERAFPLSPLRDRALRALGWEGRRVIEVVEIRPPDTLEGDVFSGFFSRRLREDYVRAGRDAARMALNLP